MVLLEMQVVLACGSLIEQKCVYLQKEIDTTH
jgi:hypothetical protein